MSLTDNDIKALGIIAGNPNGKLETKPSWFGFDMYPKETDRRWPQGMALCGGKALRRLVKGKLITEFPGDYEQQTMVYRITDLGRETLKTKNESND